MNNDDVFVQGIQANSRDDIPWLILADYLEEAGEPRASLIRVQVELSIRQNVNDVRLIIQSVG